jgi:protein-S-isoprenylcysteine O-methyltransferase Ste14
LAVSILSIVIAKIEEKEDIRKFGEKYLAYMQATKMFIPFII